MGVIKNINYAAFQNCIIDEFEIKKEIDVKRVFFVADDFTTGTLNGVFFESTIPTKMSDYDFANISTFTFGELQDKKFN